MLSNQELLEVKGGTTATYINAIARISDMILNLGRTVGSSIRRAFGKNYC